MMLKIALLAAAVVLGLLWWQRRNANKKSHA